MEFEWDGSKARHNLEKHGIDFADVPALWDQPVFERRSQRHGEPRWLVFGLLGEMIVAVVYTWRGEHCRIISARKASRNERASYYEACGWRPPEG